MSSSHDDPQGSVADPFSGLATDRECGTCTACCEILNIDSPELTKPADTLCANCTGTGCGIYETRPDVCRTWYCLWRRIGEMPDYLRPDLCGVVFAMDSHEPPRTIFERAYIVARTTSNPAAFETGPVKAAIQMFIDEGSFPIWLSYQGEKLMIYPDQNFAEAILNPKNTEDSVMHERACKWRKRYGLD